MGVIIIVAYIIYYYGWKDKTWERKRDLGATIVVFLTIILLPFHFWGLYNLAGIENGGLYESSYSEYLQLGPGDTFTTFTLSNRYAVEGFEMRIGLDYGNVSFYLCDRNVPDVKHSETNISYETDWFNLGLPYIFSSFITPAEWTLNFYNPSQSDSVVYFEISIKEFDLPPPSVFDDPLLPFQLPTVTLFSVWIVWAAITLVSYENMQRSLRPKAEPPEDTEFQEIKDNASQDNKRYERIRERKR